MTAIDVDTSVPAELRVRLHPAVRDRRIRDLTYLLGPDGTTCVALPDADLAAAAAGEPAAIAELRRAGLTADAAPPPARRLTVTTDGLEIGGFHSAVEPLVRLLRHAPHLPWGALAVIVAVGATVAGLMLPHTDGTGSVVRAAVVLLVLDYVLLVVHELGHAVVLHWHGERVGRAGFGLHWGMPSFFVDATAALMLPRRARAWQAAAGVLAEGTVVAALLTVAALTGSDGWALIAGQAAVLVLSSVLVNLIPALDLDGAWLFADLLDRPQLIHRTSTSRWIRVYGIANGVIGIGFLASSVLLWASLWGDMLGPLWSSGLTGIALVAVSVFPMVIGCLLSAAIVLSPPPSPDRPVPSRTPN